MTQKRQMIALLLSGALLCAAAPARAVVNEYQTLELVRTYASEDEVRAAYPDLFPEVETMTQDDEWISLPNGKKLKTFETEPLTDHEKERVQNFDEANPVIKNGVMRRLSIDYTFLLEAKVSVKMRDQGYRHEGDIETKTLTLYNAGGELITQLPPEALSIETSPTRQYFVAYDYGEYGVVPLYFYQSDGTLLQQQMGIEHARIRYSQNGEFVVLYSNMERIFKVFTKTGNVVYQGDYTKLINDVNPSLFGVFASEQGKFMLLCTDRLIHLYTIQGGFLWMNPFPGFDVADCWFFSQQGKIALKTITSRTGDDFYNLQIHSLDTGDILDEIVGIAEMIGVNNHLIYKKGGQYYEYQVR